MFSAIWIVVANSWQQTPAGFHIVGEGLDARAEITDFWAMVFNPSSVDRLLHVWIGALLAGCFLVLSVNAWYIRKGKYLDIARPCFRIALIVGAILSISQLFIGHRSADGVARNQPAKLAAMEGHFESSGQAHMYLFGYVDKEKERTVGVKIPGGLSYVITGEFNTEIKGLNAFRPEDRPQQVNAIFQLYHLMVAIGTFMILLSVYGCYLMARKKLFEKKWLMSIFVFSVLLPQVANQAGWFTAEMGRQPWVVYGLLRTSDALSKTVTANQIMFSLVLFTLVYALLFVLFVYLLNKKIKHGPVEALSRDAVEEGSKRNNPMIRQEPK
jgi:cytochrome d ubiquinol oxidase subunit I